MVNGTVMATVRNEQATAERARGLPWSEEEEQAVRPACLSGQAATGRYPHLAALLAESTAPADGEDLRDDHRPPPRLLRPGGATGTA
ncbi:hypothetical protein [Streptomyces sp. CC208A]|uniref:hypothetical protein n=1 Tax=Streptomyces sp. CC208A TaxID=3044573 RepID=UPI0024A801C3|nr:hypothetical protein [Streptomyces sp. CC208A]